MTGESDDASDIEGYLLSERQRQSLTQQSVVDDLAARRKGTPRLVGSAFPPPPGLLPPPPPADGSGPLTLFHTSSGEGAVHTVEL